MTHTLINGWTKERLTAAIAQYVPLDHQSWDDEFNSCAYFGRNNDRCAMGACLPDDAADRWPWLFEDAVSVSQLARRLKQTQDGHSTFTTTCPGIEELFKALPLDADGMRELQNVHDECEGVEGETTPQADCLEWVKNYCVEEVTS